MNKKFNEWLQYEEHYINGKISCMTRDAEYIENLKDIKKANIEYDFFRNKNITVIEYILKMMDVDYNSFKTDYNSFKTDKTLKLFLEFKKSFIDLLDFLEINNELKNKNQIFKFYTLVELIDMSYIHLIDEV